MAALVTAMVLSGLWLLGRPRPRLLDSAETTAVAALNRAQVELVQQAPAVVRAEAARPESPLVAIPAPGGSVQERLRFERWLRELWRGEPADRLRALDACRQWGHPSVLPWLRRGLRDGDAAVVALASEAIGPFRGPLRSSVAGPQPLRLPRNVARTR
ncbi:MAG: HEAT repeat domain-containing protein [Prochlorococcaceae cyanobacterium]